MKKKKVDPMALNFTGSFKPNPEEGNPYNYFPVWAQMMWDGQKRIEKNQVNMWKKIDAVNIRLSKLEVKSSLYGTISGFFGGLVGSLGLRRFIK